MMAVRDSVLDTANCSTVNDSYELRDFNLTGFSDALTIPYAILILALIATSLLANTLLLFLVAWDKRLRYRSMLTSLNVVVADILMTIFYLAPAFASTVTKGWVFGDTGDAATVTCTVFAIIVTYILYVRWIAVGFTAMDKFLTVRFPFRYIHVHPKVMLLLMTITTWLFPVLLIIPSAIPTFSDATFRANQPMCLPHCSTPLCGVVLTLTVSISLIWGALLPSGLFTWMYCKGRKLQTLTRMGQQIVTVTVGAVSQQSMAHVHQRTRDRRAIITLSLVYLTNVLTNIPVYLFLIIRRLGNCVYFDIPIYVFFILFLMFYSSTLLNPLVVLRSHDVRVSLKRLLKCKDKIVIDQSQVFEGTTEIINGYLGNHNNKSQASNV